MGGTNNETVKKLGEELSHVKKSIQELRDIIKKPNTVRVMEVPEGAEREAGFKDIFNEILENFPNMENKIEKQNTRGAQNSSAVDQTQSSPQHLIKLSSAEHKQKILKCARERNQLT